MNRVDKQKLSTIALVDYKQGPN